MNGGRYEQERPKVEFEFEAGGRKYTAKGVISGWSAGYAFNAPVEYDMRFDIVGSLVSESIHTEPHFNTEGLKHRFCNCRCPRCSTVEDFGEVCICKGCDCGA